MFLNNVGTCGRYDQVHQDGGGTSDETSADWPPVLCW